MAVHLAETQYTCGWSTEGGCAKLETALGSDVAETRALAQQALDSAAEILYGLSGRQFGLCTLTLRPCRLDDCGPCDMSGFRWTPALVGGSWVNVSCGRHDPCSCTQVSELRLPGPVSSVTSVRVDGALLVEGTDYRLDSGRSLVRLGGAWPLCQDMNLASSEPGTWEVEYLRGKPVPSGGRQALGELANELYKACTNDTSCKLPKRVTSIVRDGVTMAFLDPQTFLSVGLTGLYMVDLWLRSVNPKALSRGAAILSPDMPVHRRTL